jgi:hypothetical protein
VGTLSFEIHIVKFSESEVLYIATSSEFTLNENRAGLSSSLPHCLLYISALKCHSRSSENPLPYIMGTVSIWILFLNKYFVIFTQPS